MINVKTDGGAAGDGLTDDWEPLQDLINAKKSPLYFPPGLYRIEQPLEFPDKTGYHLVGCGLAPPRPTFDAASGAVSAIIWGGADGGTMIKYHGTGLIWSGLSLWGCSLAGSSSSCPAAHAALGIEVKKISGVVGTGKIWFDSILIAHCEEAIATTETNNDDNLIFGYCWFEDCA